MRQVTLPVRWDLCLHTCADLGVTAALELAPAGTLTGIAKRELPGVELLAIKTPDDLDKARRSSTAGRSTARASTRPSSASSSRRPRACSPAPTAWTRAARSPRHRLGTIRTNREEHEIVAPQAGVLTEWLRTTATSSRRPAARPHLDGTTMIATRRPAGARILGLGHYRPANVITNHDLIARGVDTDDEWIKSRVGIAERRWADPDETVVDMAEAAGSKALASSGVAAADIDLVLVATCTMPDAGARGRTAACRPARASTRPARTTSVPAAPASSTRSAPRRPRIRTAQARNVLVVASERFSGWLDMNDRSTCIILGDGAGAAVVGPSDEAGIGPIVWGSDGAQYDSVAIDAQTRFFRQEGQAVYRWATGQMAPVALEACRRAGVDPADLAAFVPHQANLRIIDALAKRLGATDAVIARDIVTSGNTSAASIPLALSRMVEHGEIPSGKPVLLLGFGSGWPTPRQVVLAP